MSKSKRKTTEEKIAILEASKIIGMVEASRKYGISYPTLKDWKLKFDNGGATALSSNNTISNADLKKLLLENQRLKELVAEKELHIKIQDSFLKKKR